MKPTGTNGFAAWVIRNSSAQPMQASATIAAVNVTPPTTMMKIAKTIHGTAHAIRASVSERRDGGRGAGFGAASSAGSANISSATLRNGRAGRDARSSGPAHASVARSGKARAGSCAVPLSGHETFCSPSCSTLVAGARAR